MFSMDQSKIYNENDYKFISVKNNKQINLNDNRKINLANNYDFVDLLSIFSTLDFDEV